MTVTIKPKPKAPAKTVVKPVVASVNMIQADGSESDSQETVGEVQITAGVPEAKVEFQCGLTKNLGNYESLKFHVGITIPCSLEDANEAYTQAKQWVDAKVNEINEEIAASLNG